MGVESLIYDLSGLKYQMAQEINEQLETVGFVDLGVKARPNLVVLKRTRMPAVLVEVDLSIQIRIINYLILIFRILHRQLQQESWIHWKMPEF